ncbi:hypothetical protein [Actinomyces sp. MRS3W]|uniref:hypothetical protein n=1 Tax=Actinomyces sp. MRS3W TaxID=2800796 RepID=UPI0028FD68C0|nr:hypothetical protein [Actinomyces sp. MRS3W]MDU0348846.1 hypothetical protein [Actinomyces sp. MRS3W]
MANRTSIAALPTVVSTAGCLGAVPAAAVPLMRGQALLPQTSAPHWAQKREVTLARAVAAFRSGATTRAVSHEAAVLFHGGALRRFEPDIDIVTAYRPRLTAVPLPQVIYGGPLARRTPEGGRILLEHTERLGRRVQLRRHYRNDMSADDVVIINGLPVTSLARTLTDCLLDLPPADALVAGDSLLRVHCRPDRWRSRDAEAPWRELVADVEGRLNSYSHRNGSIRARHLLELLSPWAESPGESELRRILLATGLPQPDLQHRVVAEGNEYFLDLAWPDIMLDVEFDGALKYAGDDVVFQEGIRQDRLKRAGWQIVRFKTPALRDPEAVRRDVLGAVPVGSSWMLQPRAWMDAISPLP